MATIYTLGYQHADIEALARLVNEQHLVIADTRITPYSPLEQWQKANLAARFGRQYVHIREFGNELYKEGGIQIVDMQRGISVARMWLDDGISLVLLCACHKLTKCHRLVVARELSAATGYPVTHLLPQDLIQSSLWWQL